MVNLRVIPVVLLKNGRIVQSKLFKRHQVLGMPSTIIGRFSNWFADEVIYLDISRKPYYDLKRDDLNFDNKGSIIDIIHDFSLKCFMPLTVGGGVKTILDIEKRLHAGADKVAINTQAFREPTFISRAASKFGSQCIVVSIDAKHRSDGSDWEVYVACGKEATGLSPMEWAKKVESLGAGEILINSIDEDGQGKGYDLMLIKSVVDEVKIPVIAMGGVSKWSHFADCIDFAKPSAVAASNIFQYTENSVFKANSYLYENNYQVRKPAIETLIKAGDQ